jgi:hypothetical protein
MDAAGDHPGGEVLAESCVIVIDGRPRVPETESPRESRRE